MRKIYWFAIILFLVSCEKEPLTQIIEETDLIPKSGGEIVSHTYFSLAYSEAHEQAEWVFFKLIPEYVNGNQERTDDFREDPLVSTGSATLEDYKYSGYDRGHLCPAGSMTQNYTAMSESFYLSNMSPQMAGFNRGIWSRFEGQVRNWVNIYGVVWEVTGPIFKSNLGTIGANQVTVPGSYYKIVFRDYDKMIGFLIKHESSSKNLSSFAVKVDSIEALTGIDFFPGLENEFEKTLESKVVLGNWVF